MNGKRILVGPQDIAGFGSRIAVGLASGGANVLFFNATDHLYNPKFEESGRLKRLCGSGLAMASRMNNKATAGKVVGTLLTFICKLSALFVACVWSEVCVFIGGKGILTHSIEYLLLRLLGKRVIHIFIGTASRPRYMSGYARDVLRENGVDKKKLQKLVQRTRRQAKRVRDISRRASLVIENPLCGQFHQSPFINYFKVGIPLNIAKVERELTLAQQMPVRSDKNIRILHCPSRPEIKGSYRIRSVIEKLTAEGLPIEFRQLSGIPHSQVLREIKECDFVIDQLFSDTPMAGFAAEASALGKTALVGSYGWRLIERDLEPSEIPPTVACDPEQLEATIRKLVSDPEFRKRSGTDSKQFLAEQWSDAAFASRFARLVCGEIPDDWWITPQAVRYIHGAGIEEENVRRIIGAMVDQAGAYALQVDHNPDLREQMIAFANSPSQCCSSRSESS